MNRENAKALLPIITAFAEGKTIQFFNAADGWRDMDSPMFSGEASRYRIKPEPNKVYVIRRGNGTVVEVIDDFNRAAARHTELQATGYFPPYTLEEYVQVLEGDNKKDKDGAEERA